MNFAPRSRQSFRNTAMMDITPLVDVVFQLLIFFTLTASYVRNPNFEINLPKASSQLTTNVKKDITVVVTQDGELKYDTKPVGEKELEGILEKEFATNPAAIVLIKADTDSRHGKVVEVMDIAKKIGFTRLGIAVQVHD